jgi:hypothetical protein
MRAMVPRNSRGPEAKIQDAIIAMLRQKRWHVMPTHGNMYQSGFPDLFATHARYGPRWIEVKLPGMEGSRWTPAQKKNFPAMIRHGSGIWVLTAATSCKCCAVRGACDCEYRKLFDEPNYWKFTDVFKRWHSGV